MANNMIEIKNNIATIERIFNQWNGILGGDYLAYKNHVYRVYHFCLALNPPQSTDNMIFAIAASFHDIGIWANKTFDYLQPSTELAGAHLKDISKTEWLREVELMIYYHHKITTYNNSKYPLVEVFRRADWIDVSKGKRSFGVAKNDINAIINAFPNHGFHQKLVRLTFTEFKKRPFKPLPMMKW